MSDPAPRIGRSVSDPAPPPPLHITFVCSGNICRSPMAEKMFAHQLAARGVGDAVRVSSAGTGGWHAGSGADERAVRVLADRGYPTAHRAAQVGDYHLSTMIGWTLLGRPIDDDEMVELLETMRPHRYRVVRLLEVSRLARLPRRGARLPVQNISRL